MNRRDEIGELSIRQSTEIAIIVFLIYLLSFVKIASKLKYR